MALSPELSRSLWSIDSENKLFNTMLCREIFFQPWVMTSCFWPKIIYIMFKSVSSQPFWLDTDSTTFLLNDLQQIIQFPWASHSIYIKSVLQCNHQGIICHLVYWDCLACIHQLHLNKTGIIKHSVKFSYFSFEMYSHLIQIDVN